MQSTARYTTTESALSHTFLKGKQIGADTWSYQAEDVQFGKEKSDSAMMTFNLSGSYAFERVVAQFAMRIFKVNDFYGYELTFQKINTGMDAHFWILMSCGSKYNQVGANVFLQKGFTLNTFYPAPAPFPIHVQVPEKGRVHFFIARPEDKHVIQTRQRMKDCFVTAFSANYTRYHGESKSALPVEEWLRLRKGVTFTAWLEETFDEEFAEFKEGTKGFLQLSDEKEQLIGWLSHSAVGRNGDVYLSQCSLDTKWQNQRVATTAFKAMMESQAFRTLFPGVTAFKLIVRKINTIALQLYKSAGFVINEHIDPKVYGSSYDDRYVGCQLTLNK